ncbi:MAG: hypothetical protein ACD_62C00589G0001 [uncultured bacterium]|nr:MAG: hypothetical protein ACD_62C00589G0001 [uncultured bacterium]HLD45202.1 hypothetical protein [bacterium]
MSEKSQKTGWTYGGLGAFCWLFILGIVLLIQKNFHGSFFAFVFFAMGIAYLIEYAPWKYPAVPFWKIYLGLIALLFLSTAVLMCLWDDKPAIAYERFTSLVYLFPMCIPMVVFGKKTWNEMQKK